MAGIATFIIGEIPVRIPRLVNANPPPLPTKLHNFATAFFMLGTLPATPLLLVGGCRDFSYVECVTRVPICEEIGLRYLLQEKVLRVGLRTLLSKFSVKQAIYLVDHPIVCVARVVFTAICFAAMHRSAFKPVGKKNPDGAAYLPALFLMGLSYGIAQELTHSVIPSIAMHAINNFLTVLINKDPRYTLWGKSVL